MIEIRTKGSDICLDLATDTEFEIEISNPLFESDRIPVGFSTAITFPPSETNRSVFGYLPAMFLPPSQKRVEVYLYVSGINLMSGTLVYDSVDEDGNLVYTFTEKELNDYLDTKIWKLNLPRSRGRASETDYPTADELASQIRNGDVWGIGTPVLFDPDGSVTKFHNLPAHNDTTRFTPCVSIQRMISAASGLKLDFSAAFFSPSNIYVLGLYKSFTGDINGYGNYLSIAQTLPDVTLLDVLKEFCKLACSSVYKNGDGYAVVMFDMVGFAVVKDWDSKVSDKFSLSNEPQQGYRFGWPKDNDTGGESDLSSEIIDVSTLKGVLDARQHSQYTPVRHTGIGDTYSVPPDDIYMGDHDSVQVCELLNDSNEDYEEIPGRGRGFDGDTVDNHLSAYLIKNVPIFYEEEEWDEDDSYPQGGTWITVASGYRMAGQVTFPADGGERDSKLIFGVYESGQLVGKGKKMVPETGADANATYDLSAGSLYQKHQAYQSWIEKSRSVVSVDLDLSVQDIADFRMWHTVMVRNQMFVVKKLRILISTKRDSILSTADLVRFK